MRNNLWTKGLILGITILFIGGVGNIGSPLQGKPTDNTFQNAFQDNRYSELFVDSTHSMLTQSRTGFLKRTYMVPMPDGVRLATDVYLPLQFWKQHGAILLRTPYERYDLSELGRAFSLLGWPTVIQDMRGTGDSEGKFNGFRECQTDGPATLAWIANQTWSNGKVVTVGPSALGITQYFMAGANPQQLACQAVMLATPNLYKHAIYPGGEFRKNLVENWLDGMDASYLLDEIFANENSSRAFWINVTLEDNWDKINVPAIHMGGWYDHFLQGILDGYDGYQHRGGPGAVGKSKLIVGPWWHEGYDDTTQGELVYPENCRQFGQILSRFFKMATMYASGKDNGFESLPTVWYYVMGDVDDLDAPGNEWRTADDWPIPAENVSWYFNGSGGLSRSLPDDQDPLAYTYDPTDPVPTIGGQNSDDWTHGPYDQTSIENRSDVLVFTSDVFTQPYEATGRLTARLFVSSDCPDTDFTVKLTDVYPDGRSMLIADGILRMRNHNGTDHWEFMTPGEIYPVDVDLWSTSYIWNVGHRLRVAVSSSNFPRFLANPNTRDSMHNNETYTIASNTLYVDSIHPSCLILPEIAQTPPSSPPGIPRFLFGLKHTLTDLPCTYRSAAADPENDRVSLLFDWGDGTSSGWVGPFASGNIGSVRHTWKTAGVFEVRVKAKDSTDSLSDWSDNYLVHVYG